MSNLNANQNKAIKHKTGPLLVIAGAGTGKTTVITERIKHIVSQEWAKTDEVLALTFTEKAASEMQERVDIAMPLGYTQMWISTFHGFCDQVLRDHGLHIGLDPHFKLLTQARSLDLFRKYIFDADLEYFLPLGNPTKFVSGILTHFSRLQDEAISPTEYIIWAKNLSEETNEEKLDKKMYLELAHAYQFYDNLKIQHSYLDFGDLIIKTIELFEKRPNVLSEYRKRFKYILIDEFQDTNFAQNKLALSIAGEAGNITVVGDDDQSIYRFRGAAISNILEFRNTYPDAEVVVLTDNYRSTQTILDASHKLISYNNPDRLEVTEKIDKQLVSHTKEDAPIEVLFTTRGDQEAEAVCEHIDKALQEGHSYKDIAVLVRANSHADIFINSFEQMGIPYQFLGPEKLFQQPEIEALIAYLKVLYDKDDTASLTSLLSSEYVDMSSQELVSVLNEASKDNQTLFEKLQENSQQSELLSLIDNHQGRLFSDSAGILLYEFLNKMNILTTLLDPKDSDADRKAKNIAKLFDKFKLIESDGIVGVRDVVDWIALTTELGESPAAAEVDWQHNDAINILTIHSSKGLEFPIVFVANLVEARFPSRNRSEQIPLPEDLIKETLPTGDFHLQEERRLMYVAMTRAKQKLYLTGAQFYGDAKRAKKISNFVTEIFDEDVPLQSRKQKLKKQDTIVRSDTFEKDMYKVSFLSYSQIQAFQICPLHYKLRYILKLPVEDTAALSFGTSVHNTLQSFYFSVKQDASKAHKDTLLHTLEDSWMKRGYQNKKHEQKSYKKAQQILSDYYDKEFDKGNLPVKLEESFLVTLPKRKGEGILKIRGKIDRVDILDDGIEIIDYKTGSSIPSQNDVDKNLQLTMYALAAYFRNDAPFDIDIKKIKLSLYYFEEQKKISTVRTQEQLEDTIDEIYAIRKEIEESDFECSNSYFCQSGCEFSQFCNKS